jgi:hypothetical protein
MLEPTQRRSTLRTGLSPLPARMARLPVDHRGYPVPWFVQWIDGEPDFRVMDREKWRHAIRFSNCWLCGEQLGRWRTFVIGPMGAVNRVTSEPPCHIECAEFAAQSCPFLTLPRAQYTATKKLPTEEIRKPPGVMSVRNPGVAALWTCESFNVFNVDPANFPPEANAQRGQLLQIGEPKSVSWWALAKRANRDQVLESVMGGYPDLERLAKFQGAHAVAELRSMYTIFTKLLPP